MDPLEYALLKLEKVISSIESEILKMEKEKEAEIKKMTEVRNGAGPRAADIHAKRCEELQKNILNSKITVNSFMKVLLMAEQMSHANKDVKLMLTTVKTVEDYTRSIVNNVRNRAYQRAANMRSARYEELQKNILESMNEATEEVVAFSNSIEDFTRFTVNNIENGAVLRAIDKHIAYCKELQENLQKSMEENTMEIQSFSELMMDSFKFIVDNVYEEIF